MIHKDFFQLYLCGFSEYWHKQSQQKPSEHIPESDKIMTVLTTSMCRTSRRRTELSWLLPGTYFSPRVHLLGMGGDTTQSLGGGSSWGVTLLHKVWEVDVTCEAITVTVARSLLFFSRLRGATHRSHQTEGTNRRMTSLHNLNATGSKLIYWGI